MTSVSQPPPLPPPPVNKSFVEMSVDVKTPADEHRESAVLATTVVSPVPVPIAAEAASTAESETATAAALNETTLFNTAIPETSTTATTDVYESESSVAVELDSKEPVSTENTQRVLDFVSRQLGEEISTRKKYQCVSGVFAMFLVAALIAIGYYAKLSNES